MVGAGYDATQRAKSRGPRRRLVRMHGTPDGRVDAVGADHEVALHRLAAGERDRRVVAGGRHARDLCAQRQRVPAHGFEQGAVQHRPQRDHRHAADCAAAVADVDSAQHAAVGPPHFGRRRRRPGGDDGGGNAQFLERGDGVGRQQHGEAELTGIGGALEDADPPSGLLERQAGGQTADAGTDDERRTRARHDGDYAAPTSTGNTHQPPPTVRNQPPPTVR